MKPEAVRGERTAPVREHCDVVKLYPLSANRRQRALLSVTAKNRVHRSRCAQMQGVGCSRHCASIPREGCSCARGMLLQRRAPAWPPPVVIGPDAPTADASPAPSSQSPLPDEARRTLLSRPIPSRLCYRARFQVPDKLSSSRERLLSIVRRIRSLRAS